MSNTLLYPYLIEFFKWAKTTGIPQYKKFITNNKEHTNKVVRAYVKRHPEYESLLYGKYPQHGGGTIEKLNKVYNAVKSINPQNITNIHTDLTELDKLLTTLESKLNSVESGISQNNFIVNNALDNSGLIQSTIDIIKNGLINLNEVTTTNETGQIPVDLIQKVNYTEIKIEPIIRKYIEKLDKLRNDIDNGITDSNIEIDKVTAELGSHINKITADSTEIQKANETLKQAITQMDNDMLYVVNKSEIKIVPEFNAFLNIIKSKTNDSAISEIIAKIEQMMRNQVNYGKCVDEFNRMIPQYANIIRQKTEYAGFTKYYDGINNTRISNMFFSPKGPVNITMIRDMIIRDDINKTIPQIKDFDKSFLEFPEQFMKGGAQQFNAIDTLRETVKKYNMLVTEYNNYVSEYRTHTIEQLMHNIFLVTVATNQFLIPGYVVHDYIQRGALSLYLRILNGMVKDIESDPMKDQNIYLYKYHKITICKLRSFLSELLGMLNNEKSERMKTCKGDRMKCIKDDIIDINECTGKTAEMFLLLNHFKNILMQYNAMSGNKITIFARINDLGRVMPPTDSNSCDKLMYLSMFDEYAQVGKCSKFQQITKPQNDVVVNRKRTMCSNIKQLNKQIDVQTMIIHPTICTTLSETDTNTGNSVNVKFTEVFDPTQFPTSSEISKYMTLDTLLSQGHGIGMMTYGYSGTGKSFTLFGNTSKQIPGILQTTLNDIIGLRTVKFRVIELYGLGMPYPHYWTGGSNTIHHKIYNYKVSLNADGLRVDSVDEKQANEIQEFMNDTNTYNTIEENMVSEVFKTFETFVSKIDDIRTNANRIRDTPNNIVSSRSVVIYDFQLEVYGKNERVPFLIVDLPGREEIIQTYVEPYLGNSVIRKLLDMNDKDVEKLKLILGIASVNPIGLAVFEHKIILDILTSHMKHDRVFRDNILGELQSSFFIKNSTNEPTENLRNRFANNYPNLIVTTTSEPSNGINITGNFKLLDEFVSPLEIEYTKSGKSGEGFNLGKWVAYDKNIFKIIETKKYGFGYTNSIQTQIVLCTHLMNRIIMLHKFDIIEEIIKSICNEHINNKIRNKLKLPEFTDNELRQILNELNNNNFKSLYWNQPPKNTNANPVIDTLIQNRKSDLGIDKLVEILGYNYYLTPYEGIYINENIVGLMKYLAFRKETGNDTTTIKKQEANTKISKYVEEQDNELIFSNQQKIVRVWAMTQGNKEINNIRQFYDFKTDNDVPFSFYAQNGDILIPNNIVKIGGNDVDVFEKTYENLSNVYNSNRIFNFNEPLITKVLEPYMSKLFGYNVLYLLANYDDNNDRKSKCQHQHKLLQNTVKFIESIVN